MNRIVQMPKEKWIPMLYMIASIVFAVPSAIYIFTHDTIYYFFSANTFLYRPIQNDFQLIGNFLCFLGIFLLFSLLYYLILKNHQKIFQTPKQVIFWIAMIGIIFTSMLPITSWDVYSYIGNGWVDAHYGENPYYTSVQEVADTYGNDRVTGKVARCWREEPVIYGPAWSLICKGLTSLSFGSIDIALFVFKIATFLVFLSSCYLVWKLTKKQFWVLFFGLNPFILFDALTNVHNDIFLVFFVLISLYLGLRKQKVVLAIGCMAIATAIKYVSVLLVPFFIIYVLRKERIRKRIGKTLLYTLEFVGVIALFYSIYIQDFSVFAGIFIQQNKYTRSLFLGLWFLLNGNETILDIVKMVVTGLFAITYILVVAKFFFAKEQDIKWRKMVRAYQILLLAFLFFVITNFNSWYIMWLFPTIFWQRKNNIKMTACLGIGSILAYSLTYATLRDDETMGIPYLICMLGSTLLLYNLCNLRTFLKLHKKEKMSNEL